MPPGRLALVDDQWTPNTQRTGFEKSLPSITHGNPGYKEVFHRVYYVIGSKVICMGFLVML
jgi:hypothetical protein